MLSLESLQAMILSATELLPAQGPITAFVFDNTLRGLEDLPFHQAVKRGSSLFHCQPYLSLGRFREKYQRGRITDADLNAVLLDDLGEAAHEHIAGLSTRLELRRAMLRYPLVEASAAELQWFVAENDVFRKPLAQATQLVDASIAEVELQRLWVACDEIAADSEWRCESSIQARQSAAIRHRDLLLAITNEDSDLLVNDVLIRFTAAFVDQGLAEWILPYRDDGYLKSFVRLYGRTVGPPTTWLRGLAAELKTIQEADQGALDCIAKSLDELGVTEAEAQDFITATLLALRGWGGLLWQNETRSDRVPKPVPKSTLIEFLAVRLLLERFALKHLARQQLGFEGSLNELRSACRRQLGDLQLNRSRSGTREISDSGNVLGSLTTSATVGSDLPLDLDAMPFPNAGASKQQSKAPTNAAERASERCQFRSTDQVIQPFAFVLFQLAQYLAWPCEKLSGLGHEQRQSLIQEVAAFDELDRRRLFHLAFEHNYRQRALNAVSVQATQSAARVRDVRFQAVFCIDAREESFRRHLEEVDSRIETFGAPGFFCLPIYYRGLGDAHFSTLCPIVVRPQHWVIEEPVYSMAEVEGRRASARRALGTAGQQVSKASRNMLRGAVMTASFGVLASIPLVARVLFPRLTAKIRRQAESLVRPVPVTRLRMERLDEKPSATENGFGFTLPEMANFGERLLRDIGLVNGFARLVMFLGHGSVCQNNPHKSAYDCGACSGMAGVPNARALAAMLNDPRVRDQLRTRGIDIPAETHFLGGLHNTGDDTVTFTDIDFLPRSHRPEFEAAKDSLDEACLRNAHERCRRFFSAPLTLTPIEAHRHVEDRTEDLAQVRPEFGNSTNAMCYVGRRSRLAGLFMDRRCFMHSYDPTTDDAEATILGRILGAVVFVCSGINLQYLFSYIDSPGWGSGTKLPHNITSLLGVMDGAASDLRTGLPWQGVEIHEPVRLLCVIESTPENLIKIMDRNAVVGRLIRNEWVQLAVLHPESRELMHFKSGNFERFEPDLQELPIVGRSMDWYRGQRDHLGFARVER